MFTQSGWAQYMNINTVNPSTGRSTEALFNAKEMHTKSGSITFLIGQWGKFIFSLQAMGEANFNKFSLAFSSVRHYRCWLSLNK